MTYVIHVLSKPIDRPPPRNLSNGSVSTASNGFALRTGASCALQRSGSEVTAFGEVSSREMQWATAKILSIEHPREGKLRARKVVSRSKARPTGKYPSWKMKRMMQWESVHELHTFRLLDADPNVLQFMEQPLVVTYQLDGVKHEHYPDIIVKLRGAKELWEVKPRDEAEESKTLRRTELMTNWLPAFGFSYRMVVAETLALGAALVNASELLRHGRRDIPIFERERIRRLLKEVGPLTWGAIRAGAIGFQGRSFVSRLILEGALHFDRSKRLTDETIIAGSGVSQHK